MEKEEKTIKKEKVTKEKNEKESKKSHQKKCECKECHCEENEKKIKQLEEALLVSKADLVNYRKRKDEETSKMLKYASEDLIKSLLPVVDNFERAIMLDDDDLTDELSKFLKGFKMIYGNLENILRENEVKQIDGVNKPFDPNYHQAVLTEKTDGEKGIVLDVMQKGYIYKEKVIRPAMVKVSE
jgi:molecular chaperone GrpE